MNERTTALVTGLSAGWPRSAGRSGWGARDEPRREQAVAALRAEGADVFAVPLDVTDDASVAAAADLLEQTIGRLDVLVNNAAITGGMPQTPTTVDLGTVREVLETNVLGVMRTTNAMLPLLRRSPSPRIVMMSSSVGSLTRQSTSGFGGGLVSAAYAPSKTLLNAIMLRYVRELSDKPDQDQRRLSRVRATDLNQHRGHRTPEQGARIAIRLATLPDDGPTGGFFEDAGSVPW